MIIESYSPKETENLAASLVDGATPGAVFALSGDLGVGKTIFAKGMAEGLGIEEPVVSPTFTILQEYKSGRLPFYHFDVYRIEEPEEMEETGFDDAIFGDGVSLIEWAEMIEDIMPEHYTKILIEKAPEKGFDYRKITITQI
ncbi:MAG: tRNA (adenosine(37)-N6)-threonylcarbamoyltransferase complex ATPase subunit type 1 TsaE [Lachnospiraceae bacterium]|jgi:tRNA threonylcarbamoyladenosine biosynthesis protein TsaE|nr:tRNA (adenosine(37)-N6)-threonylcarbamoyltransferase complex ATPase subunit type 1 TsaE [Lachnospiraceae bacterium]